MLPVVKGAAFTRRRIVAYSVLLVACSLLPVLTGLFGVLYLLSALALGAGFLALATRLLRDPCRQAALQLYLSSLAYLFVLFAAMAADRLLLV